VSVNNISDKELRLNVQLLTYNHAPYIEDCVNSIIIDLFRN